MTLRNLLFWFFRNPREIFKMSQKAAHVMTARQKKGALSSVKKAKLPKNVMVKHDIDYWPSLDEKQNSDFFVMLET